MLTQKLQLTTEDTEKYIDNKRKSTCFYSFLCAFFYSEMNLAIRKIYKKGHRELFENKSFFNILRIPL